MLSFTLKPALIAIHIPKTAGSTIHEILKNNYGYGLKHIHRVEDRHQWNNGLKYRCNRPFVKAVYGHIMAHKKWKEYYPDAKIITWTRDPVERIISTYYFWKREGHHIDKRHEAFEALQPSLLEFAEMKEFQPTVRTFERSLEALSPDEYFFAGRQEYFDADIKKVGSLLGWKNYSYEKRNVNSLKPEINPKEKQHLKELLKGEYKIYNDILAHAGSK